MTQTLKVETTGDMMLRDIIANPHDLGLRSIYADWLEDEDRKDAASIAVIDGVRKRLVRRISFDPSQPGERGYEEVEYRHGFIEVIRAPFEVLCKGLPTWVTQCPLTSVEVSDREPWSENEGDPHGEGEYGWWESCISHDTKGMLDQGSGPKVFEGMWSRKLGARHRDSIGRWMLWKTRDEAIKALSDTLLDMARKQEL